MVLSLTIFIEAARAQDDPREQYIPVLCVTTGGTPTGTVSYVMVMFAKRNDTKGLNVHFVTGQGRFSPRTQAAIAQAIASAARALGLSSDSWSIGLSVADPGVTIDGGSLSAMVSLTVVSMAKGESIPRNRVITGTVTSDGRIGPVGGVALKVTAARQAGLQMVLVPSAVSGKERIPTFTQVFQVGSVSEAYQALTAPQHSMVKS
jgi:predicted S18 family serine protease